jgi:chromosome segregation ATPase
MKYLEELEKKVLHVVNLNKELRTRIEDLQKDNELLKAQNIQLQGGLMKEASIVHELTRDKEQIKNTIEELLSNISVLETTN